VEASSPEIEVFHNLTQDRSTSMTDQAMSPLRRRMIEDMTICNLSPRTQEGYIRTMKSFAAFLGRSPDTASFEDVRRFQLHLATNGIGVPTLNHTVSALLFSRSRLAGAILRSTHRSPGSPVSCRSF